MPDIPNDRIEIQKAFEQVVQEMRNMSITIARLRYMTGDMHVKELMHVIKTVGEWNKKPIEDLEMIEVVEQLNKQRDDFYKRVLEGAKSAEQPAN